MIQVVCLAILPREDGDQMILALAPNFMDLKITLSHSLL